MNILPNERGQVQLFVSREFCLEGKGIDFDLFFDISEAENTLHAYPHGDFSGGKESAIAQSDIQRIGQRRNGNRPGFLQTEWGRTFLPFDVESLSLRDLAEVDFHGAFTANILGSTGQRAIPPPQSKRMSPENVGGKGGTDGRVKI